MIIEAQRIHRTSRVAERPDERSRAALCDRPRPAKGLLCAALLAATASCSSSPSSDEPAAPPTSEHGRDGRAGAPRPALDDRSVIVRWKKATGRSALATRALRTSALAKISGSFLDKDGDGVYDRFRHVDRTGHLMKVDLARDVTVDEALAALRANPDVAYAQPNYRYQLTEVPDDPRLGELWGLHNTGQQGGVVDADIDAPEAWSFTPGSRGVVIGVVDSGVDYTHPDLAANMWTNPGEIAGNGLDDDGNGFVDDVHGVDVFAGDGDPMDDDGHGTHCAGSIGAVGGNGVGVSGVNQQVSIMALRFGLDDDNAIAAIDYALAQRAAGVNLRVLSNSWGGDGESQALREAIAAAGAADILFVAGAGNGSGTNIDNQPFFPASYDLPNVVSVAATTRFDTLASFSNIGPMSVDLGAPGQAILSTQPGQRYRVASGTSMATPHVAGAAALALSLDGSLDNAELKALLLDTGDPLPALEGGTVSGRRLNAGAMLEALGRPGPRFRLGVSSARAVVNQGASASLQLSVDALEGFTGEVSLSVSVSPAFEGSLSLTPEVVAAPGVATLEVAATAAAAVGSYTLTVTAQRGGVSHARTVILTVRPLGTVETSFPSADTPLPIPTDGTPAASVLHVEPGIDLLSARLEVNLTHPDPDLQITLTSPEGTKLHLRGEQEELAAQSDGARGEPSPSSFRYTFGLPRELTGQQAQGDWVLRVADVWGDSGGTLDSWTLHLLGPLSAPTFRFGALDALTVRQGRSASTAFELFSINGFGGPIALSVSSPDLATSFSFDPDAVIAPGSATLTVAPSCAAPLGTHTASVIGSHGEVSRSRELALTVLPFRSQLFAYPSADLPAPIPDDEPEGLTRSVEVAEDFPAHGLAVEVHITHPNLYFVLVELIAPDGQVISLHAYEQGRDLHRTFVLPELDGMSLQGTWSLRVTDTIIFETGTLDSWTLHVEGPAPPVAPTAAFTAAPSSLTVAFSDASTSVDCGGITGWAWDFGDGTTSSARHPSHDYAASGTYQVSLTVTAATGLTATTTRAVTVRRPQLVLGRVFRSPLTFAYSVDLSWSDAVGGQVELYRNGQRVALPHNDGAHRDSFRSAEASFTWRVCERPSGLCSNEVRWPAL